MKMKKFLSIMLAAACMISCVGCGEKKSGNGETITYYVANDPQTDIEAVEAKLSELTMEKIGVKVNLELIDWSAWKEKTNMMFASGEDFDVMSG